MVITADCTGFCCCPAARTRTDGTWGGQCLSPMSRKQYCRRYVNGRLARFNKSYFHGWKSRLRDIGGEIYDEKEGRKEGRKGGLYP